MYKTEVSMQAVKKKISCQLSSLKSQSVNAGSEKESLMPIVIFEITKMARLAEAKTDECSYQETPSSPQVFPLSP